MRFDDWFLTAGERANPATQIDRRRPGGLAWTEGNAAQVLVHGRTYFSRLYAELCALAPGAWIQPVGRWNAWWAMPVYRRAVDPDGRPRRLRHDAAR